MGLDPFAPALYAFSNRRRDRIKILGWGGNGFWLLMKYLASYYNSFIWM
jgi:transposase